MSEEALMEMSAAFSISLVVIMLTLSSSWIKTSYALVCLRIPIISDIEDVDEAMMGLDLKPSTLEVFKLFKSNNP